MKVSFEITCLYMNICRTKLLQFYFLVKRNMANEPDLNLLHMLINASNQSEEHSELANVTVIWYDSNIDSTVEPKLLDTKLNVLIRIHTQLVACVDHIKSAAKVKIFMIIPSISCARDILPQIHNLRQTDSIFLLTIGEETIDSLLDEYSKIVGCFANYEILTETVREYITLAQKQKESWLFYNQHRKFIRELSKQSASFLWFSLFKNVLFNMSSNDNHAKQDLIEFLRQRYYNNKKQLKLIADFESR